MGCSVHSDYVNVEIVARPELTKYLYKYMSKGPDCANVVIEESTNNVECDVQPNNIRVNEIREYLDCRYISSVEGCWRILGFDIQTQYPTVIKLHYHLPNHQWVTFNNEENILNVVEREHVHHTMLTRWFEVNTTNIDARTLTYVEFPTRWVWNITHKRWTPRKGRTCIGRLPYAQPTSEERYYLRMLLNKVRGAQNFDHLKTVDGITHSTFKSACVALGLLQDDNEWDEALSEATIWASAVKLRYMFTTMLMFSEVSEPLNLWLKHWRSLTDDFQHTLRRASANSTITVSAEELQNLGFSEIENILNKNGHSLSEYPPMPVPSNHDASVSLNTLIRDELDYDPLEEVELFKRLHSRLNEEQLQGFNDIVHSYEHKLGGLFFVCGSGGTGKTYLWRTLIAKIRSEKGIVISVASSGISALLLPGGRTAHSRFKIPINPDATSTCHIKYNSDLAGLIREASMIIWDEAPMMHRYGFEAVDRTLSDILKYACGTDDRRPFNGKLFVLGGDFRQTLPIVTTGSREATIDATITRSPIWRHCRVLRLTRNMRVFSSNLSNATRQQLHDFSTWILSIGDGTVPAISLSDLGETNWVKIPDGFLIKNSNTAMKELIDLTYPDLHERYTDTTYLKDRAILAPKNIDVNILNGIMLATIPGVGRQYLSADSISDKDQHVDDHNMNPPEYLNSLDFSEIPNHCLSLKEGAPVILLRNLNQSVGMYNGTRLQITRLGDKVLEAKILTGTNVGDRVIIPRITLSPPPNTSPFPMKRRQFPLKLAFSMTINKSQGQSLKNVGVYLPSPVFSHGQLYVAISRVTSPSSLKILVVDKKDEPSDYTQNIVYREVFDF